MSLHILTGVYDGWHQACQASPQLRQAQQGRGVELDLGCGKGGFLLRLAERYPERVIIGAEIMLGRLRRIAKKVNRLGHDNVELFRVDAWELMAYQLPDALFDRIHILCPDPWPKARHRGNRLVSSEFLGRVVSKLRPGGILHLATDDAPYFETFMAAAADLPLVSAAPDGIADIAALKTDFQIQWEAEGKSLQRIIMRRDVA